MNSVGKRDIDGILDGERRSGGEWMDEGYVEVR